MIKSKYSKKIGFIVFCLGFMFMMCGAATAASTSTTHNNISQTSPIHTSNQLTSTSQTLKSNVKSQDPQIYRNGVAVARGGHPAGYSYSTIGAAIHDALSGDTIMLAKGATFHEHGLTISKNLNFNVLNNGQATITGAGTSATVPIFTIKFGATVNMQNIVVEYAKCTSILNDGTLTVKHCTFKDNNALPNGSNGGAIYNTGTLTIISSTLNNNKAGNGNTAQYGHPGSNGGNGGAIYNTGTLTITSSTLKDNTAGNGGVVNYYNDWYGGNGGNGGAIYNTGKLTITSSTLKDNTAGDGVAELTVATAETAEPFTIMENSL